MAEEPKACPFCSCTDIGEVTINLILEPHHRRFKVYCKACQCRTSEHKTRKEARIYWNTRAQLPNQGGEAVEVVAVAFITRAEKSGPKIAITLKKEDAEKQHKNWLSMSKIITTEPLMTVAQHSRIVADLTANRDALLNVMRARKMLPKCEPSPDAELVRQCIAQELATREGDFKGPVHTAMRCLQVRIDAKLASLKGVEE